MGCSWQGCIVVQSQSGRAATTSWAFTLFQTGLHFRPTTCPTSRATRSPQVYWGTVAFYLLLAVVEVIKLDWGHSDRPGRRGWIACLLYSKYIVELINSLKANTTLQTWHYTQTVNLQSPVVPTVIPARKESCHLCRAH